MALTNASLMPQFGQYSQFPLGAGTLPTLQSGPQSFNNALSPFSPNFGIAPTNYGNNPLGIPGINLIAGNLNTNPINSLGGFSGSPSSNLGNFPALQSFLPQTGLPQGTDPNLIGLLNQLASQTNTAPSSSLNVNGQDLSALLASLGVGPTSQNATPAASNFETLLKSLTVNNHPKNTRTVNLATYDINLLRELGDDTSLGGNGDKVLSKTELAIAKEVITLITDKVGTESSKNPALKSLLTSTSNLTKYFDNLAGADGKTDGISAQDIVTTAQNDDDKKLETIQLKVPIKSNTSSGNLTDLLSSLLTGSNTSSDSSSLLTSLFASLLGN